MSDLFDYSPPPEYPSAPGYKGLDDAAREASRSAAASIGADVKALRRLALVTLHRLGEATPLQAIEAAGADHLSLQPRFSELKKLGLAESTGVRLRNPSGKTAAVLRLTEAGRRAL